MKKTEKAFHWIINILEDHKIEYMISGGFAARVYGSKRALADIDIVVNDKDISVIHNYVKPFIIFGPSRYQDENWDLELMTLNYENQEIDIAGIHAKIFNKKTAEWELCNSDFHTVKIEEIFGKNVPIESKESLINYKSKIARRVDLVDIKSILST